MSDPGQTASVVVDTNVFPARFGRRDRPLFNLYGPMLAGRAVHLSFVTVAEARFGARLAGWGPPRLTRLEAELARVDVVWPDDQLTDVYADLRTACHRTGHGLAHKTHEATGGSRPPPAARPAPGRARRHIQDGDRTAAPHHP